MALVVKNEYMVQALVFNKKQKEILQESWCSRLATHCLNIKLRELNKDKDIYDRKWFTTQKPYVAVSQVGVITLQENIDKLKGVQFFDKRVQAEEKLKKKLAKNPDAEIIEIELYKNVPKSEQKNK